MLQKIKDAVAWFLSSKKIVTAALGFLAALAVKHLGFDDATANDLAMKVITVFVVLVGAQGLADLGSGEAAPQLTIWQSLKAVFLGLISSRKLQTAVAGVIVMVLVKYLKIGDAFAQQLADGLFALVSTLLGAQGLQDLGKTKAAADGVPAQPKAA